MKVNELRIGNKVLFKDKIVEVVGISGIEYSFNTVDITILINKKFEMHPLKSIKPIQLTEDILLKCKPGYSVHVVGELYVMPYHNGDGTLSFKLGTLGHAYPYEIKYLHHWQNFYYVMEGKELEVQL